MASIRGFLAKWLGGAGASQQQAGIRSLLARWLGGAAAGASSPDLECGGSADVARTRSYEGSGGSVFDGSAVIAHISGAAQDLRGGIFFHAPLHHHPKATPATAKPEQKRRVRQTYSYLPDGGLELSASAVVLRNRSVLAIGGSTLRIGATVERTRTANPGLGFISGGLAGVEIYDAIYDTEDEEIEMLMAFAA